MCTCGCVWTTGPTAPPWLTKVWGVLGPFPLVCQVGPWSGRSGWEFSPAQRVTLSLCRRWPLRQTARLPHVPKATHGLLSAEAPKAGEAGAQVFPVALRLIQWLTPECPGALSRRPTASWLVCRGMVISHVKPRLAVNGSGPTAQVSLHFLKPK